MKIYSIYNTELRYFNRPMFFESDAEVKQYILNVLCADSDRALSNLRDVLELHYLGEIDFSTGFIYSYHADVGSTKIVCSLSDIWSLVPVERVPRDSLKLNQDIKDLKEIVMMDKEKFEKVCACLKEHFKFLRKEKF